MVHGQKISSILLYGETNARTAREICDFLNVTPRALTRQIEMERRGGAPICASNGIIPGYYLAENKGEMTRFCRSLEHRINEISQTRRACLDTIPELPDTPA